MKKETRTKTVKETVYIASDGKEFSGNKAEFKCTQYEAGLNIKNKEKPLWEKSIIKIDNKNQYLYAFKNKDYRIELVYIESKEDFKEYLLSLNDTIFYENFINIFTSPGWYILTTDYFSSRLGSYPVYIGYLEDELYGIIKEYRDWAMNIKQSLDEKYLQLSKKYEDIKLPNFSNILN